ncbi:fimbrial protein, partial [Aeromonas jandaei]|uniref:fimbrial protein n=1 Tax=Aeromonas jandaei TaxID=650 RepID=UPI002AA0C4C8
CKSCILGFKIKKMLSMLKKRTGAIFIIAVMSAAFQNMANAVDGQFILKGAAVNSGCYISDNGVVSGDELLLRLPVISVSNVKKEPDVVHVMEDQQGIKFTCSEDVGNISVIFSIPNGGVHEKNIYNTASLGAAKGVGVRLAAVLSASGEQSIVPSIDNWLDFRNDNAKSLVISPDNKNHFSLFMGANYVKMQNEISSGSVDAKVTITLQAI